MINNIITGVSLFKVNVLLTIAFPLIYFSGYAILSNVANEIEQYDETIEKSKEEIKELTVLVKALAPIYSGDSTSTDILTKKDDHITDGYIDVYEYFKYISRMDQLDRMNSEIISDIISLREIREYLVSTEGKIEFFNYSKRRKKLNYLILRVDTLSKALKEMENLPYHSTDSLDVLNIRHTRMEKIVETRIKPILQLLNRIPSESLYSLIIKDWENSIQSYIELEDTLLQYDKKIKSSEDQIVK